MCIFQRASIGRRQRALFERLALDPALGDWDPRDWGWGEVVFGMGMGNIVYRLSRALIAKATAMSSDSPLKRSAQSASVFYQAGYSTLRRGELRWTQDEWRAVPKSAPTS